MKETFRLYRKLIDFMARTDTYTNSLIASIWKNAIREMTHAESVELHEHINILFGFEWEKYV